MHHLLLLQVNCAKGLKKRFKPCPLLEKQQYCRNVTSAIFLSFMMKVFITVDSWILSKSSHDGNNFNNLKTLKFLILLFMKTQSPSSWTYDTMIEKPRKKGLKKRQYKSFSSTSCHLQWVRTSPLLLVFDCCAEKNNTISDHYSSKNGATHLW